tara:strand:+ start:1828 stop:2136 length:309 start_codon:yes stop_codon:yes gene_type:complete
MDLPDLIKILKLATHYKIKARALISDSEYLDDDLLEKACHYYLSLRTITNIIEKILLSMDEEVIYDANTIKDTSLIISLYLSIKQNSKFEDLLTSRISIVSH